MSDTSVQMSGDKSDFPTSEEPSKKILYIYDKNHWDNILCSTMKDEANEISKYCTVCSFEGLTTLDDDFEIVIVRIPIFVAAKKNPPKRLVYEQIEKRITKASLRLALLGDIHEYSFDGGISGLASYLSKNDFHVVLWRYPQCREADILKDHLKSNGWDGKFYWIPHSVLSNFFDIPPVEKNLDIILFGCVARTIYPLRYRIKKILGKLKDLKIRIIIKDGSLRKTKVSMSGEMLIKELSRSHLVVATRSKYNYLLRKYFEISAAGSVILGDMPIDGENIWGDNYVYVDGNMTDEEIESKIRDALFDKKGLEQKAQRMKDIIFKEHTTEKRISDLFEFVRSLDFTLSNSDARKI